MEKTIAGLRQLTALDFARLRKVASFGSQPELDEKAAKVAAIVFQPEASGDYAT